MEIRDRFSKVKMFAAVFLSVVLWISVTARQAGAGELGFDDKLGYDIYYYSGGDNVSLLKDVEILRIQNIHDADFLVVQGAGFKVENEEGYIRFDSIRAILPHSFYRVTRQAE